MNFVFQTTHMLWRQEECLVKTLITQTSAHTAAQHQVSDKSKAAEVWKFSSIFSLFRHELIDWRRALPALSVLNSLVTAFPVWRVGQRVCAANAQRLEIRQLKCQTNCILTTQISLIEQIIPVISWVISEKHCFTSTVYISTCLFLLRSSSSNTSCTSAELALSWEVLGFHGNYPYW